MATTTIDLQIKLRVPGAQDPNDMANLLIELVGEGQGMCKLIVGTSHNGDEIDRAILAREVTIITCNVAGHCFDGPFCDCDVDTGEADYVGDGYDGVYYQVFKDRDGTFYYSTLVACNTSAFHGDFSTGVGPYDSRGRALDDAFHEGCDWCACNGVNIGNQ